jgi:hypothetical protein
VRKKEQLAAAAASPEPAPKPPAIVNPEPPAKAEPAKAGTTIVIEGGVDEPDARPAVASFNGNRARRLNPIKQKQMEDRCAFLEEEIPRMESSIVHTEQQLGTFVSATETQRLSDLASSLREQLAKMTAEWEELTLQLEA